MSLIHPNSSIFSAMTPIFKDEHTRLRIYVGGSQKWENRIIYTTLLYNPVDRDTILYASQTQEPVLLQVNGDFVDLGPLSPVCNVLHCFLSISPPCYTQIGKMAHTICGTALSYLHVSREVRGWPNHQCAETAS